jgi:hypothetical protein
MKPEAAVPTCEPECAETVASVARRERFPSWIAVLLFSSVLLVPCFWQSRIQSADLGSHVYNAWLASEIHRGALPGLWISTQSENILFELALEWLFVHTGPGLAQRISVSVAVLIFAWGALLFVFRMSGRNWWFAAPCIALLSYGFVFDIGFFNCYLSTGLCLWYLAITWNQQWQARALASPLLVLAWFAHPFPVIWAVGIATYGLVTNRVEGRRRVLLLGSGIAVLFVLRDILVHRYACGWSLQQVFLVTGASQLVVFGAKYGIPFGCLLSIWLLHARCMWRQGGLGTLLTIPFQLWILTAAAVFLLPNQILFPQFGLPFGFIASRLSLLAGILLCAALAALPAGKKEKIALVAVTLLFFGMLYRDDRELNRIEDRIDAVVRVLPPGRRVVSQSPGQPLLRSLSFHHSLDRACIGHCFSYANYEPSSKQFRLRARAGNGFVMDDYSDVDAVGFGKYVVRSTDLPLQVVYLCGPQFDDVCSRLLHAGEMVGDGIDVFSARSQEKEKIPSGIEITAKQ